MNRLILFFTILLFLIPSFGHGQNLSSDLVVRFENLTVADKLPSHRVLCVCQDERGFMWFGTEEGLCRYDGQQFIEFFADINAPYSLHNNSIRSIVEDRFGNLWIGTDGGGLHYFDQRTWRFYSYPLPYQPIDHEHSTPGKVYAILRTSEDQFWIGSYGQGLYILPKYRSPQEIFKTCEKAYNEKVIHILPNTKGFGLHDLNVFSLYQDRLGTIWIGTDDYGSQEGGALHRLIKSGTSSSDFQFEQFRSVPNDQTTLGSNYIMSMYEDAKGRFWVCNWEGGLNLVDRNTGKVTRYKKGDGYGELNSDDIYSITEDEEGGLWLASYGGGISRIAENEGEFKFIPYLKEDNKANSLIGDYVRQIFTDRDGLMWAITWKSGISRIRISRNPFTQIPMVNHTSRDTISEEVKGLRQLDDKQVSVYTEEQGYNILNLNSSSGLAEYSEMDNPAQWPEDPVWSTALASQFKGNMAFEQLLSGARVHLEDSRGNLWIGKGTTLFQISPNQRGEYKLMEYEQNSQDPTSLKGFHVTGIVEDRSGKIWISTFDALNYFDHQFQTFKFFTMKDGLPGNAIAGMLIDNNNFLWLATDNGLARFDPIYETTMSYSQADGLPFLDFCLRVGYGMEDFQKTPSFLKLNDGRFLFSSIQYGFLLFHPDEVYRNLGEPKTWITEFRIMNKAIKPLELKAGLKESNTEISFAQSIILHPDDKSFSFSVSVLDYFLPEFTQFAYKLNPIDDDWRYMELGLHDVTFSLLPHGEYNLEVIGSNSDGIWCTKPTILNVYIPKPWWNQIWFKLLVFISVSLFVLVLLIRSRQRNEIVRALQIEKLRGEEQEKFTQMRMRFYTNVTHEFRTQLALILGPLGKIEKKLSSPDGKTDLSILKRNSVRLLNLVNQLMDFRKIETKANQIQVEEGDLTSYVKGICDLFRENSLSREILFEFDSNPPQILGYFDRGAIDKMVFNLLSNAFKYTEKKGHIRVSLTLLKEGTEADVVKIIVEDNGKGIPVQCQNRIFDRFYQVDEKSEGSGIGLSIVKSLTEMHYGHVKFESEEGKGTRFIIEIPISKEAFAENEISDRNMHHGGDFTRYRPIFEGNSGKEKLSDLDSDLPKPEVLIVEDNSDMLSFISGILTENYRVRKAGSAENALNVIETKEPELIITDLMMPGIGGMELIKILKNDPMYSHIPIIIISALEGKDTEISGLRMGADDFIRKPFESDVLLLKIRNIMKSRRQFRNSFVNNQRQETPSMSVANKDQEFLNTLLQTIDDHYSNAAFGVKDLVEKMGMSHSVLLRKVKSLTGQNLNELIVIIRLEKAHESLLQDKLPVKEAAYLAGFSDPKYFSTRFKKKYGKSPSDIFS